MGRAGDTFSSPSVLRRGSCRPRAGLGSPQQRQEDRVGAVHVRPELRVLAIRPGPEVGHLGQYGRRVQHLSVGASSENVGDDRPASPPDEVSR